MSTAKNPDAVDLVFLWHMHQPEYTSPKTGRPVLPWVRMHATRAYLDMARVLARRPGIQATVNFVPSLVRQLEAYVGGLRDDIEVLAEKRAEEWTPADREMALARLFSVHRTRALEPRARYRELFGKRGGDSPGSLKDRAAQFSPQDLRDLVVLFHLASLGFTARSEEPLLAALDDKGAGYSHEDVLLVLERQRSLAARVLPAWRALATRGQVELSTSPYYHPIIPLLIDSEVARRSTPDAKLPARFQWPEDAVTQIARGKAAHEKTFGHKARGMWPPEGSLSPEAVVRYAREGVEWLVTDEHDLWRSLAIAGGPEPKRGQLYQPWDHGGVTLLFRDHDLSDRIGFAYAQSDTHSAVADFLGRVRHAGHEGRTAVPGERPLVTIALDGENAWESYPGVGEPFLTALYQALDEAPDIEVKTISAALEGRTPAELRDLHSGSWIDAAFQIWIGDPEKNRAWDELGTARRRIAEVASSGGDVRAQARVAAALEQIYVAEGSDWFWWFGEPFSSAEDPVFAQSFRGYLEAAYRALETDPPSTLSDSPAGPEQVSRGTRAPLSFIKPKLNGRNDSFYEWYGAGRYDVPRGGAMNAGKRYVERILFGFDEGNLYLRLDPALDMREELRKAALSIEVSVARGGHQLGLAGHPNPEAVGVLELLLIAKADLTGSIGPRSTPGAARTPLDLGGSSGAYADVVEIGVPFAALAAKPGDELSLSFRLLFGDIVGARLPFDGQLTLKVPDAAFEAEHWSA